MIRKPGNLEQHDFHQQLGTGKNAHGKPRRIEPCLTDEDLMPFGKHKDEQMMNVPDKYLLWLFEQSWLKESYPKVYAYIYNSYEAIKD